MSRPKTCPTCGSDGPLLAYHARLGRWVSETNDTVRICTDPWHKGRMPKAAKIATATACALFMIAGQAHAEERLSPDQRATRVRYETLQNPHSTTHEVRRTIVAAAGRFNVSASAMLCIANRESNFQEGAYNASSGAAGLFQHLRRYWPSRVRWYNHGVGATLKVKPHASPFAMRANSLVSARMIRTGGYGPWSGGC